MEILYICTSEKKKKTNSILFTICWGFDFYLTPIVELIIY